jgi:hypothetical protein
MSTTAIKEFGRWVVSQGRDETIQICDLRLKPNGRSATAERWRAAAAATPEGQAPATMVLPDCIDSTLGHLLWAIDDDVLHLSFTTERGERVYLPVDGRSEMCGWYGGGNSWRTWYTRERIVDADDIDMSHLKAEWGTQDIPDDPAPNLDELEMPRRAIEELGILLVRHVRDIAIQSCDLQLLPHSQTPMAQRWRKAAIPHNGKVPPEILIPDCVDETIFTFLRAIDKGLLPLSFTAENGETVDLVKEGQGKLADEYIRPGGWRDQFSKERINHE